MIEKRFRLVRVGDAVADGYSILGECGIIRRQTSDLSCDGRKVVEAAKNALIAWGNDCRMVVINGGTK